MTAQTVGRFALAGLTGLLYPLCFPHFDFGFLAWIALVPMHVALERVPPRRAFWLGWAAGLIAFIGVMYWVVTAMHLYGQMPIVPAYLVMLLLAAYLGVYVAVYALGIVWIRVGLPTAGLLGAPFLWVSLEWVRTHLLSGLPWDLLGYSQYRWLEAIQIADITGVYGVSFTVVLVNVALSELALWARRRFVAPPAAGLFPWSTTGAASLAMVVMLVYGMLALRATATPAASLRIGVVQPNVDQAHKWDDTYRRETLDRFARLTASASSGADFVLWPEAATPFLFEREPRYQAEIADLLGQHRIALLFGSPTVRFYPDGRPYLLNSAYLLSREGAVLGRYDKRHLVPFGEYIPLRPLLFFLDKLVVGIGDFEVGTGPTVLSLPAPGPNQTDGHAIRLGVAICYEVIFPDLVRQFADGADLVVTITNDAWFGDSAAPYQHFGMVVLRAVENRVPFARSANTGVSGFIDRDGRILEATPIFQEVALTRDLPIGRIPTFYTRYGDVFAYTCAIITGIFAAIAAWPRSLRRQEARGHGL